MLDIFSSPCKVEFLQSFTYRTGPQLGVLCVLNVWRLMVLMFSEECMWEQMVEGLKKLCHSGCVENRIELSCSVIDGELNEWLSNCLLLTKHFSLWD
jgi:hypothetical protein